jgi:hypothetical protein
MTVLKIDQQREIVDRAVEVTFEITYRDGSVANLPVNVKALEMYEGGTLIQSFFFSRGQIERTGPSTYRAYINPLLYSVETWLTARWAVVHPSSGVEGWVDVDVFMAALPAVGPAPTAGLYNAVTVSEVASVGERRHLIASEIERRFSLLLKRFNGTYVAFFLRNRGGTRCLACWDMDFKKSMDSRCRDCWGTGWKGGYSKPILGWCFHDQPPTLVERGPMGEKKRAVSPAWWTISYPTLRPGDFFVKPDGSRWRLGPVDNNKMEGEHSSQVTRQVGTVQRVNPDDVIMQLRTPDLRRPDDIFVGFLAGVTKVDGDSGIVFEARGTL